MSFRVMQTSLPCSLVSTKKSVGIFLLLGLLTLCLVLPSLSGTVLPVRQTPTAKLGTCPEASMRCLIFNPNRCESDSQCPGEEKCCDTGCGLDCVSTQQVKPGTCPLITSTCRMLNPPNKCEEDSDCPDTRKCCMSFCGKDCLQPNQVTVKPGTCPLIMVTCFMLNPPNKCEEDSDCPDTRKCCMSTCGKDCLQTDQVELRAS
ncbi:antileukoproteinase-like [Emydura macquarii macquarii]|uniref:antileukoproteinase-like n=1 Tax=Emydura macquarii macquarii TaxID=1129001 RepID=UPI00352B48ED